MIDIFGTEIKVGDLLLYVGVSGHSVEFRVKPVLQITNKKIRVHYNQFITPQKVIVITELINNNEYIRNKYNIDISIAEELLSRFNINKKEID